MPTGTLPRILQRPDGSYATPDGKGGFVDYTGQLPDGTSAANGGKAADAFNVGDVDQISHTWDMLDNIQAARGLSQKPLATGMAAEGAAGFPVVGKFLPTTQNRANLQVKLGSIAGDLRQLGIRTLYQQTGQKGVGSVARNAAEQQALQSSLAPLGYVDQGGGHLAPGPSPDAATLNQGLDTAENIYLRHQARMLGLNPDDPTAIQQIRDAAGDPTKRASLLSLIGKAPAATGGDAATPIQTETATGNTQSVIDPKVAKIAPQLTKMLNNPNVSPAQIQDFVSQNGIDPSTWDSLNSALAHRGKNPNFQVSPYQTIPLTGVKKALNAVGTFAPGGVPIGASLIGAGDLASFGLAPDAAGIVHSLTGQGPTRADVTTARDASASEHPLATFIGNVAGGAANPIVRGGGLARTMLLSGLYGGASSDDPSVSSRLTNAAIASTIGAATHGLTSGGIRGGQAAVRAVRSALANATGNEAAATDIALQRAAAAMPKQEVPAASAAVANGASNGVPVPAAAAVNRAGQEFLSRVASSSPAARTAASDALNAFRQEVPQGLHEDFNQAIRDAAPPGDTGTADFLNRPVRDITADVQKMAGREFEVGTQPIAHEPLAVTPELTDTLTHERVSGAVKDALNNHQLDPATRGILRNLPGQLKALDINIPGANPDVVANMRAKYAAGIPLTVDAARNIATALNTTANKMAAGSEAGVTLRGLSNDIRNGITNQYPEFQSINGRYASRIRAIDAMHAARDNFFGESPQQIDALAKAGKGFSDAPNEPEFKGIPGAEPSGPVQPSNRQFAIAGAREAATTAAGAGTGSGTADILTRIANGVNQAARNSMVAGDSADNIAARADVRANVADAVNRVASGPNTDSTASLWKLGKYALMTKATGGAAHYAAARALASIPNMSGEDAARVTRIYMDAGSADQALNSLSKYYGAARARTIISRLAGLSAGGAVVRNAGAPPPNQNIIGAPVQGGQ